MNFEERRIKIQGLFDKCEEILLAKGHDYSEKVDALSNFKRNAEKLGLSKYQIWSVYFHKHIDAVDGAVKRSPENPQVKSEPLDGRIKDAINYLALLYCLLDEDEENGSSSEELKPGDRVKVLRASTPEEDDVKWNNEWAPDMDEAIGRIYTIRAVNGMGIEFESLEGYWFPPFVLQKID